MDVRVCGPNLRHQNKGTFHVHAHDCGDLKHYGPGGKYGGDQDGMNEQLVIDATVMKIVFAVYDNGILEEALHEEIEMRAVKHKETPESMKADLKFEIAESYASDFWFAPCVGKLSHV